MNGRIRPALRAGIGCSHEEFLGLTRREHRECAREFGEEARRVAVAVDPIPAEKRAYYDAVEAAYHDVHTHAIAGHPPAIDCKFNFGLRGVKGETPAHSLKLGPLPCYVIPPKGILIEEADIPRPY